MKKIIILLIPFLLTGCFGLEGKGYLSNTCTKEESSTSLKEDYTYKINFKAGVVNTVEVTDSFTPVNDDISYIKDSLKSYKSAYQGNRGVDITISDDGYTITYVFDMSKVSDEIKKSFNLNDDYNDQIAILKEQGMICK